MNTRNLLTTTTDDNVEEFYFTESKKIHSEDNDIVQHFENSLRKNGKMQFKILDNGGEPFKVTLFKDGDKLNVTISDNTDKPVNPGDDIYPRKDKYLGFSKTIENIDQIWVGCGSYDNVNDRSYPHYMGNTALIVKGKVCTSLASSISRFELAQNEHITRYVSTVGNSAVPYGWIETNKGYYALSSFNCDTGYLNKSDVDESKLSKFAMNCWIRKEYPFKKMQKIPKLKLLIPRG